MIAIVAVIVIMADPVIVAVHVNVNSPVIVIVIDKVAASSIAKLVDA